MRLWSGAVRWQEVELYPAGCGPDFKASWTCWLSMDAVVVENEMDPTSIAVRRCHQFVKKVQEQEAVLPIAFDPCEACRFWGLRAPG